MKLSTEQEAAISAVNSWYKNETKNRPYFKLYGCAGTGKTTLAKYFAQNVEGTVKFGAFTGKAAHVMAKKGCVGATTLHQMIYTPAMPSKAKLRELEKKYDDTKAQPEIDYALLKRIETEIESETERTSNVGFALNPESDLKKADLLIIAGTLTNKMAPALRRLYEQTANPK